MLLSVRISSTIAVAAAREIYHAGWRTPQALAKASWQDVVDALGRAHYKRYDESTATALGEDAKPLIWIAGTAICAGCAPRRTATRDRIKELLQEFRRIGPVGAEIFCREAQGVWPELRPPSTGAPSTAPRASWAAASIRIGSPPWSSPDLPRSPPRWSARRSERDSDVWHAAGGQPAPGRRSREVVECAGEATEFDRAR